METIGKGYWEDLYTKINTNFTALGDMWQLAQDVAGIRRIPAFFKRINPLSPGSPGSMLNRFVITSAPDTHEHFASLPRLKKFINLVNTNNNVSAHVMQGDILTDKETKALALTASAEFEAICDEFPIDVLPGIGNHDTNSYFSNETAVVLSKTEQREKVLNVALDNVDDVVFDAANPNTCYYYKDYLDDGYKVRVIHIDLYDMPQDVDGDSYKYVIYAHINYSNKQLNWLANIALNLPSSDYHVIMFGHQTMGATASYNTSGTAFLNIIDAFVTQGSVNMTDETADFAFDLDVDFSVINGFNGNFVGYFYGHGHVPLVGVTTINGNDYNNIELPAADTQSIGYYRINGTTDMATFIVLDTEDRRIFLLRYGNPCDVNGVGLPYGDLGIDTPITY